MAELFELLMMLSFGASWPISLLKSYRSRTAKGKSVVFSYLIIIGYACGIISKLVKGNITYVIAFYILNLCMVAMDVVLYYRNRKLDAQAARSAEA